MSSSPSRARVPLPDTTPAGSARPEALPFPYPEVGGSARPNVLIPGGFPLAGRGGSDSAALAAQGMEREGRARELGRQQGELESRAKFEESLVRERSAVAKALTDFAGERAGYYQKIEEEAVRLALSIARKVLHREAQVDPLLLMGIVRVTLERIEGATGVALAVHPEKAADWRRYLASCMDTGDLPEVVEDPAIAIERCELRTSMGIAALGLEVQLKEIEQGLMDLLAARPHERRQEKEKWQEKDKQQEKEKP
jgi:flagellar biosynthesis/type III secretory pathway protein FliH